MESTFEDTVLDFDLQFLTQTTTNTVQELQAKNEKLRRSVIFLKKKVLFSNSAVTRYKTARNYANILENNQVFSKEGCKQHLIEIKNFIEKVARLENESRAAEIREREKNETICELKNKIGGLQSLENQLKLLLKEKNRIETTEKADRKKICVKDRGKKGLLEKENEILRKENAKIPSLQKEIENLRKENTRTAISDKVNDSQYKDIIKIKILEKEIETLRKENAKIVTLEKEIESLRKESAKMQKMEKEIEILRRENAKMTKVGKENETLRKNNAKIPKLEQEIESLRIKNAKMVNMERINKTLSEEKTKIPNMGKEIGTLLPNFTLAVNEKEKLPPKYNTREYNSLPDGNTGWSDNSDADNDMFEEVFSPPTNDTVITKKSPIADKNIVPRESDNDNSNEVVSVDTGRGSSLAYSDNEKCLNSPEYFSNDSPLNSENIENKTKDVVLKDRVIAATIPIIVHTENQDICESDNTSAKKSHPKLIRTIEQKNAAQEVSTGFDISASITPSTQRVLEKQCLDLNSSLQCESHKDSSTINRELQKILSMTRINFSILSPIPKTPSVEDSSNAPSETSEAKKIIRCMFLCKKSESFLTELRGYLNYCTEECLYKSDPTLMPHSNNSDNDVNTRYNVDTLITCYETILQTEKILNKNENFNLDLPSQETSQHNNTNISNRLSVETDCDILQDKERPILRDDTAKQLLDNDFVPISKPSEKYTDNDKRRQGENRLSPISFPMPLIENRRQSLNHSLSEEEITEDTISKNTVNVECPHNSVEINQLPISHGGVKKSKNKKVTKLEKLKKNLEPKYKIKRATPPLVKQRNKPKQLFSDKKKVTINDTSASLNDKHVYEKAVKIMAEINSQRSDKIAKSPPKCYKSPLSPKLTSCLEKGNDSSSDDQVSQNCLITTRSKRKCVEQMDNCTVVLTKVPLLCTAAETNNSVILNEKQDNETIDEPIPKKRRRCSSNAPDIQCKRVLRSSTIHLRLSTEENVELSNSNNKSNTKAIGGPSAKDIKTKSVVPNVSVQENNIQCQQLDECANNVAFSEDKQVGKDSTPDKAVSNAYSSSCHPKDSILCCMIEKYAMETVKPYAKKIPDSSVKMICEKIEQEISAISELPLNETKNAMNRFVTDLRKLNYKHFIAGMMKYLMKPERKQELFGKVSSSNAPAMTKAEQILLYVITNLKTHWPSVDIVDTVLSNIEYTLFKLNRTPEFDVIESTSHFYALLCRYFGAKSRLRLFILDAMYCIQFKSVPLIKQCLEVWMHIIPLAHMGIAKSPLVTSLVYLLHFYKCEDKLDRVQEIRNILSRRYFYNITDWNETKILEMFKNSIKDLKDISIERKMLRLALIILAKRQGPRWCQTQIIKNLLQPLIEKENVPNTVKEFCVSMIGPLMRPYPVDMKVYCEIAINQLTDIVNNDPTPKMEEAAIMSMMFLNRHNQHGINQTLLSRKMKPMSPDLEKVIRDYVKTKPLKIWKKNMTKIAR